MSRTRNGLCGSSSRSFPPNVRRPPRPRLTPSAPSVRHPPRPASPPSAPSVDLLRRHAANSRHNPTFDQTCRCRPAPCPHGNPGLAISRHRRTGRWSHYSAPIANRIRDGSSQRLHPPWTTVDAGDPSGRLLAVVWKDRNTCGAIRGGATPHQVDRRLAAGRAQPCRSRQSTGHHRAQRHLGRRRNMHARRDAPDHAGAHGVRPW